MRSDRNILRAYCQGDERERQALVNLFQGGRPEYERDWLEHPTIASVSPELQRSLAAYINREEVQGPPLVLRHSLFPIEHYLLQLFRTERLIASANLPDSSPVAHILTKVDWGGLEIAFGGRSQRLSVWRIGRNRTVGEGDFENVRVEREAVLREFPEAPPSTKAPAVSGSDEDARKVIRQAMSERSGFIGQEKGAEIVRAKFPSFGKKRAIATR
jgi:hypothetical protein